MNTTKSRQTRTRPIKNGVETVHCPLCRGKNTAPFFEDKKRVYLTCGHCHLVFVPRTYWLNPEAEQAVYDLHQNDLRDPGYRKFLSRLTLPLLKKLKPNQKGLDFGCGPGPALAEMITAAGHEMAIFDLFYHNTPEVLARPYDFICATEVVEHLQDPHKVFHTLFSILKPGGCLGIMTKQVIDQEAFSRWHYIRDLTHICFFSPPTFEYLADQFNADLDFIGTDVILLTKKTGPDPEG